MKDWISVKDRLPEDGTYVLGYYNGGNWGVAKGQYSVVVRFVDDKGFESNNTKPYYWDTHGPLTLFGQDIDFWMPLPASPVGRTV